MAKAPAEAPEDRAARLEAELRQVRADLAGPIHVLLKIAEDDARSLFTAAGVTVGRDPTPVPGHLAAAVLEAALDAGVRLIQLEA